MTQICTEWDIYNWKINNRQTVSQIFLHFCKAISDFRLSVKGCAKHTTKIHYKLKNNLLLCRSFNKVRKQYKEVTIISTWTKTDLSWWCWEFWKWLFVSPHKGAKSGPLSEASGSNAAAAPQTSSLKSKGLGLLNKLRVSVELLIALAALLSWVVVGVVMFDFVEYKAVPGKSQIPKTF